VWIKVNQADVPHLLKLNGYTYAGAPLTIEEADGPSTGEGSTNVPEAKTSETKDKLLAVLASRYNTEQKLLDLSALGADQTLRTMGAFETKALAEKSFKALMRLTATRYDNAAEKEAAIQAITLASNDIHDVGEVFTLAHTLPRLRRLDLSGNQLQDFSKLSKWRHEFRLLEELHLVGNPLTSLPNYPAQVIEWFPSLQILDGHRVRTPEEAAESLKAWFPAPFPRLPSNLRDGDNNVASTFLRSFFSLYDHDRLALIRQFYDADSIFSLNTGTEPASSPYHNYSRNLETLGSRSPSTQQRLFTGGNVIAELWARLPATRHINLEQTAEWQIDCHTFPSLADPSGQGFATGLVISVHSRFEEIDPAKQLAGTRSFSRNFILGPSLPGAPHPFRVVSDELALRAWVPQATAAPVQAPPVVAAPVAPIAAVPAVPALPAVPNDIQRAQMILELSKQTGMNAQYSELCLAGLANWDFNLALRSFEEKKAELPPEAFITAPA
jgi:nuclear RNA export factor